MQSFAFYIIRSLALPPAAELLAFLWPYLQRITILWYHTTETRIKHPFLLLALPPPPVISTVERINAIWRGTLMALRVHIIMYLMWGLIKIFETEFAPLFFLVVDDCPVARRHAPPRSHSPSPPRRHEMLPPPPSPAKDAPDMQ